MLFIATCFSYPVFAVLMTSSVSLLALSSLMPPNLRMYRPLSAGLAHVVCGHMKQP